MVQDLGPWFQKIEFPDGTVVGNWNNDSVIETLIDGIEVKGKTVLDIGCMAGAMTMKLEKLGADCTGIEIDETYIRQFLCVKEKFGLKMQLKDMTLFNMSGIREHDVVVFTGVYYHLQNPVLGLQKAWEKTGEVLLIEGQPIPGDEPVAKFILGEFNGDFSNWWFPTETCLEQWCATLGGYSKIENVTTEDFRNRHRCLIRVWR